MAGKKNNLNIYKRYFYYTVGAFVGAAFFLTSALMTTDQGSKMVFIIAGLFLLSGGFVYAVTYYKSAMKYKALMSEVKGKGKKKKRG